MSGNYLYAGGGNGTVGAAVWDANGVDNCTIVAGLLACSPLASYPNPSPNVPATAAPSLGSSQNRLFVPYGSTTLSYPAYGTPGCTGTLGNPPPACAALRAFPVPNHPVDYASSAIRNDVLYTIGDDGKLTAFDALGSTNCSSVWKTCLPIWQTNSLGPSREALAVSDGYAYVAPNAPAGLRAVNLATHTVEWTGTKGGYYGAGHTGGGAAVAGGVLFIGSWADGNVYGYDAAGCGASTSCEPLWSYKTDGTIETSPVVSGGMMYIASADGYIRGFKL